MNIYVYVYVYVCIYSVSPKTRLVEIYDENQNSIVYAKICLGEADDFYMNERAWI